MTMQNYAIVDDGMVVNVIVWDGNTNVSEGGWQPSTGAIAVAIPGNTVVEIGATYDGTTFTNPAS